MGLNFQTHSKMCCRRAAAESTAREGHLIWATEGELVLPEVESVKWQGRGHHAYEYERETPQREKREPQTPLTVRIRVDWCKALSLAIGEDKKF